MQNCRMLLQVVLAIAMPSAPVLIEKALCCMFCAVAVVSHLVHAAPSCTLGIVLLQLFKIRSFELARCAITGRTTLYTILYDTTLLQVSIDNDFVYNNMTHCRKVGVRVLELRSCRSHCNRSCRTPSNKLLWLLLSGKKLNRLWQTCKPNLRRLLVSRQLLRWTAVPQSSCQSPHYSLGTAVDVSVADRAWH